METIRVDAGPRGYDVIIGRGLLDSVGERICAADSEIKTVLIVSDDGVPEQYVKTVANAIRSAGLIAESYAFACGERSKNLAESGRLLEYAAEIGLTRGDAFAALGGGVTGDLTGFAAAIYCRGVKYIQIPTTLLAAVDSSVGGKTGVDLATRKNLVGAFHQPLFTVFDVTTIETLPHREIACGTAECLKYGMICDAELFDAIEKGAPTHDTEKIAAACVAIKSRLVSEDEYDTGVRRLLNFGHTVGHAVEAAGEYTCSHGEAVAIGMMVMCSAAQRIGIFDKMLLHKVEQTLEKCGLPTRCEYSADILMPYILADKKRRGDKMSLVLPYAVGDCRVKEMTLGDAQRLIALGLE